MVDELIMHRCLQLARIGKGNVAPNPMVGAVLLHEGKIIGEGFHEAYGQAHAEVNCINSVDASLKHLIPSSVLYVSLEPCNHTGNTGPCTDFIISHDIKKVVVACRDINTTINGCGIEKLRHHGIEVQEGLLKSEAIYLNRRFFCFHKKQRPYIILKWAQTANGFISSGDGQQLKISNELTDRLVHKWRSEEASILVGTNTAMQDNPLLTTRLWPGKNPVRIVVDRKLKIPPHYHLLDNKTSTIIINTIRQKEDGNTLYYKTGEEENIPGVIINLLHHRQVISLIIEGGAKLLQSFIDAGLWDEARLITSKKITNGNGVHSPVLKNAAFLKTEKIEDDELNYFTNAEQFNMAENT